MSLRTTYRNVVVNSLSASLLMPRHARWLVLRAFGVKIERASVAAGCFFGGHEVSVGAGTYVNHAVFFDGSAPIRIGERVHIGMQACILTGSHELGSRTCRAGALIAKPVVIEDGCWIGARAVIMPGVTIREGTVIAVGAVVTSDCEPNAIYAGVPARKVRVL